MIITKEISIDMGHRVPNHKSKCKNLHGHRYKIELSVDDKIITEKGSSDEGMVIDYGDLKDLLTTEISDKYDHALIVFNGDTFSTAYQRLKDGGLEVIFVPFIPTAENLAIHWYNCLKYPLLDKKIKIKSLKVWETPNSSAIYEE